MCGLSGMNVLVVEDEYLVAEELAHGLEGCGAHVIGPFSTVADGLRLLDHAPMPVGAAVLDIKLADEMVFSVADRLALQEVPIVFCTGYDRDVLPLRFAGARLIQKPALPSDIAAALAEESAARAAAARAAIDRAAIGSADDDQLSLLRRLLVFSRMQTGYGRRRCEQLLERTLEHALECVQNRTDDVPLETWLWHLVEEEVRSAGPLVLH